MSHRGKHRHGHGGRGRYKSHSSSRSQDTAIVDESNPITQKYKWRTIDIKSGVILWRASRKAKAFRVYQSRLDDKHDRHERIVKISRDITIESKRTIFLLHRISGDQNRESVLTEAEAKLTEIQLTRWRLVAEELRCQDPYQYLRAYSPGLQEYIEALSFFHYQKHGSLLSLEQVEQKLHFSLDPPLSTPTPPSSGDGSTPVSPSEPAPGVPPQMQSVSVHIPPLEYVLGLADLTGELMRLAINSVGSGKTDVAFELCAFMQQVHTAMMTCCSGTRELWRKLNVLQASIKKVETACYTVEVRGSEIPKHMLTEALLAVPDEQMVSGDNLESQNQNE